MSNSPIPGADLAGHFNRAVMDNYNQDKENDMASGSVSDKALQKVLANAKKLPTKQFNNLGTRTLQQIARSAEIPGRHQGEGRSLGSRAQRELMRRNAK